MRKVIAYEMVTLDGFIGDENDGVSWAIEDPEVFKDAQSGRNGTASSYLFGRITYDVLAAAWSTPEGMKRNKFYAESLTNTPKVVVSKKLDKAEWAHTTVEHKLDRQTVNKLRQGDGNVMIFGSGTIVGQLLEMDAIDEYQLLVNPVVIGKGKKLFAGVDGMKKLKLNSMKSFPSGIVLMDYVKAA
jgi:dihydrofolate reductase